MTQVESASSYCFVSSWTSQEFISLTQSWITSISTSLSRLTTVQMQYKHHQYSKIEGPWGTTINCIKFVLQSYYTRAFRCIYRLGSARKSLCGYNGLWFWPSALIWSMVKSRRLLGFTPPIPHDFDSIFSEVIRFTVGLSV